LPPPGGRQSEIAVVGFGGEREVEAAVVERLARVEVDRAGEAAFDHLGGRVLVDLDRAEQFGRNVGEVQRLPVDAGRERITPVELRADKVEASDDHARAFDRKVVGVVAAGEAVDRNPGDALQRLGDRTVGQRADVLRGDRVDHGVGIALDVLRVLEARADAGDNDRTVFFAGVAGSGCRRAILRLCGRGCEQAANGEERSARPQRLAQSPDRMLLRNAIGRFLGHAVPPPSIMLALPLYRVGTLVHRQYRYPPPLARGHKAAKNRKNAWVPGRGRVCRDE
jgi:hypothetical protein